MKTDRTKNLSPATWERAFRRAAENDGLLMLSNHLQSLELPDEPELLLEGTIIFVLACVAYLQLDNRPTADFLRQQQYDPEGVTDAPYLLTFDIFGMGYGRIVTPLAIKCVDLADLYGAAWDRYQAVGYNQLWISRVDGAALDDKEMPDFQEAVSSDLLFDFSEDELDISFDPDSVENALGVTIQDRTVDD